MDENPQISRLKARVEREKVARKEAEKVLESKSRELFEANQELKVFAEHLEAIVAQRTQALQQATEEALKLATAKSQFLANISHEFKTPLNGILGSLTLLKSTELDEHQSYMLDTAESCGEGLVRLINNVLDVNSLTNNSFSLLNVAFSPVKVINQVATAFTPEVDKKGLSLDIQVSSNFPQLVKGDPTRFKQILEHLLSNAIKFSETGTISIVVNYDDAGLSVSVLDQGIGISEKQQQSIFDIFTQGDESFTREFGGIGLGLTLCQKLVALMGGHITLHSILHHGTKIKVTLPLAIECADSIDQAEIFEHEPPPEFDDPQDIQFEKQNVLLVEDNAINQEVARDLLVSKNLCVTIAENGLEALNMMASKPFDVVLMDIQMPVMDGLEATRHIRQSDADYSNLPILVLTAHGLPDDVKKSFDAGANEHLTKPLDNKLLLQRMGKYISWHRKQDEAPIQENSDDMVTDLYGIDLESAKERLMNNDELLKKVFLMFAEQYRGFFQRLNDSLLAVNHEEVQRGLHTLKGSAGNISALKLAEIATVLEGDLKQMQLHAKWATAHKNELKQLEIELHKVLAGIVQKYASDDIVDSNNWHSSQEAKQTDFSNLKGRIDNIKDNIYIDLSEVEEEINYLQKQHVNKGYSAAVAQLQEGFASFDYELMEQSCEDLFESLKETSQ